MGNLFRRKRPFLILPLALLLSVSFPSHALELVQEVEVLEEVKLYVQQKTNQVQEPLGHVDVRNSIEQCGIAFWNAPKELLLTSKKYIVHCNLIFYE